MNREELFEVAALLRAVDCGSKIRKILDLADEARRRLLDHGIAVGKDARFVLLTEQEIGIMRSALHPSGVNGFSTKVPNEQEIGLWLDNHKISAIKAFRDRTSLSLKDSKACLEDYFDRIYID